MSIPLQRCVWLCESLGPYIIADISLQQVIGVDLSPTQPSMCVPSELSPAKLKAKESKGSHRMCDSRLTTSRRSGPFENLSILFMSAS